MFEKDAKEYMHKDGTEAEKLLNTIDLSLTKRQAFVLINICKQIFKDGAEFGYNKAKEEINQNGLALQSDMDKTIEQNIALKKENVELKRDKEDLIFIRNQSAKCMCEDKENLTKAKEIILKLYNAGRDVLMCRTEEKAYDNLSNAINDKSIEQFISEGVKNASTRRV